MGFQNRIAKANQPKPDSLEGPDSLVPSTTWSQNRRKLYHCFNVVCITLINNGTVTLKIHGSIYSSYLRTGHSDDDN